MLSQDLLPTGRTVLRNHILHLILVACAGLAAVSWTGCASAPTRPTDAPGVPPTAETQAPSTSVGDPAPEFTLLTRDGSTFRLADARGKAVVLNFWASWCGPCREEMPRFERTSREMADRVVFVGVNATTLDSREAALEFADQLEVTFPLVFDADGLASAEYGVNALPATFFIDATGVLRMRALGPVLADRLREGLALAGVQ